MLRGDKINVELYYARRSDKQSAIITEEDIIETDYIRERARYCWMWASQLAIGAPIAALIAWVGGYSADMIGCALVAAAVGLFVAAGAISDTAPGPLIARGDDKTMIVLRPGECVSLCIGGSVTRWEYSPVP